MEKTTKAPAATIGSDVLDAAQGYDGRQVAGMYNEAIVECVADDPTYVNILRLVLAWMSRRERRRSPGGVTGYRRRMEVVRDSVMSDIRSLLAAHDEEATDMTDLGFSPIIREEPANANNSFTLDRIYEDGGRILLDCSSCCENMTVELGSLDLETMTGVLDFLLENEAALWTPDVPEEIPSDGCVFVLWGGRNNDGVSEGAVTGVFRDRETARRHLAMEKARVLDDIAHSSLKAPEDLGEDYDDYEDSPDEFRYLDFDANFRFRLLVTKMAVE